MNLATIKSLVERGSELAAYFYVVRITPRTNRIEFSLAMLRLIIIRTTTSAASFEFQL